MSEALLEPSNAVLHDPQAMLVGAWLIDWTEQDGERTYRVDRAKAQILETTEFGPGEVNMLAHLACQEAKKIRPFMGRGL